MSEKEGGRDTFEFLRNATNYLSDRFFQPLSASLLLSWAAWNYKIILIIISFDSIAVKFRNIESVQSAVGMSFMGYSLSAYWSHGFILPLVSALGFIYLYPFFSTHALKHTLIKQRVVNNLRRLNSEEELIDVTRSRELVKENAQLKLAIEKIQQGSTEKEKSLTETINILESNIIRLNEQLVSNQKSSLSEAINSQTEKILADAIASSLDDNMNSAELQQQSEVEQESENSLAFGIANMEKIRNSDFIWERVENKVYSLPPHVTFQVAHLFEPGVWDDYNGAQKAAIRKIFDDRYQKHEYVNIKAQAESGDGEPVYVSLPFTEYYGWQDIRDRVIAFVNHKRDYVFPVEIFESLGLKPQVVKNCMNYFLEKGYVKSSTRVLNGTKTEAYIITAPGKFYAEALDH